MTNPAVWISLTFSVFPAYEKTRIYKLEPKNSSQKCPYRIMSCFVLSYVLAASK